MKLPEIKKPFRKNADDSWTCMTGTVLAGPLVRVSIKPGMGFLPGQWFVGMDVAAHLEAEQAKPSSSA